jgi:G6PDH family F420-dependent oxidoreductase
MEFGYWLSVEEHTAPDLIRYAQMGEDTGFSWVMVSDHFHPWNNTQGQSPYVWSVLGGIAATTRRVRVSTGVACPLFRIHPAVLAQAAATLQTMFEGRFALGIGTGENLNEHVVGQGWPPYKVRRDMLSECIDILRLLWDGGLHSYRGTYYTVEDARIYSLPEQLIPILMAAGGPQSMKLAAEKTDGLIAGTRDRSLLELYEQHGGAGKPRHAGLTMCWAPTREEAARTAHRTWPHIGLGGQSAREFALPEDFERAVVNVTKEDIGKILLCGPDPEPYLQRLQMYREAGYTHVHFHQLGTEQEGFLRFFEKQIAPQVAAFK